MNDIIPQYDIVECADTAIDDILRENQRRMDEINAPYNPYTGEYGTGERTKVEIEGFPIPTMWLPNEMLDNEFMQNLIFLGLDGFCNAMYPDLYNAGGKKTIRNIVLDHFDRLRNRYDFDYWCWMRVPIAQKGGGEDIRFRLNLPQRKLMNLWHQMEKEHLPVRIVLLKARQWGGSTVTQVKMAHHQLVVTQGANSIIVGHVKDASTEVKDMYFKLINRYPKELLYAPQSEYDPKAPNIHGTSSSANLFYVDSRGCKVKLGSAERPESARGGDSTLAHCTEVAMWVATEGKSPEDIVRSVTGGIAYKTGTAIIYESTANGTDNFFHDEYQAAKEAQENGKEHQFKPLFVSFGEIGFKNMLLFKDNEKYLRQNSPYPKGSPCYDPYLPDSISPKAPTEREFAERLYRMRNQHNTDTDREEPGSYLWWLWERGNTLQSIYWYIVERTKYHSHADIAAEAPADEIEAFKHSGQKVFDDYYIGKMESSCRPPQYVGEIETTMIVNAEDFKRYQHRPNAAFNGRQILSNLKFVPDETGSLYIWEMPEYYADCKIKNRYLTVVDIGGVGKRSDFSVVVVIDRLFMMEGGRPVVVAQWRGHLDYDVLSWKAAMIAKFYDNSLLVIESNTIDTRDKERDLDGDQSNYLLSQIKESYPNLYERKLDEDQIREGVPKRLGFHTNVRTKPVIIANLRKMIRENMYVERDKRCLDEYRVYVKRPNGSYAAASGKHDDMLMTRAIGLWICFNEMDMPKEISTQKKLSSGHKGISDTIII